MYLRGPLLICCCHPWVIVFPEILDQNAFAKSCFPQPHLCLRADRVGVDLGPHPALIFTKDEKKVEGRTGKCEKGGKVKRRCEHHGLLTLSSQKKKEGIKLMSAKND